MQEKKTFYQSFRRLNDRWKYWATSGRFWGLLIGLNLIIWTSSLWMHRSHRFLSSEISIEKKRFRVLNNHHHALGAELAFQTDFMHNLLPYAKANKMRVPNPDEITFLCLSSKTIELK